MARTETRVFPDGDYPTRLSELYQAMQRALEDEREEDGPPLLNGEEPASVEIAREYEALKAEAEADAEAKRRVVTLRAIGRQEWRALKEKHPPRVGPDVDDEVAKGDRLAGVNTDTVEDDLVFACVTKPEFSSRAAFDEWAAGLSQGEWLVLVNDSWRLINVAQYDPKSLPASLTRSADGS